MSYCPRHTAPAHGPHGVGRPGVGGELSTESPNLDRVAAEGMLLHRHPSVDVCPSAMASTPPTGMPRTPIRHRKSWAASRTPDLLLLELLRELARSARLWARGICATGLSSTS